MGEARRGSWHVLRCVQVWLEARGTFPAWQFLSGVSLLLMTWHRQPSQGTEVALVALASEGTFSRCLGAGAQNMPWAPLCHLSWWDNWAALQFGFSDMSPSVSTQRHRLLSSSLWLLEALPGCSSRSSCVLKAESRAPA
jgi:hypothetical protein